MKLNHFELDLNSGVAPFFQASTGRRARFLMDTFMNNPGLLKKVYRHLIAVNDEIDCTFISAYMAEGRKQFEYGNIGRTIKITNVKTCSFWNNELDAFMTYSTVKNVDLTDLYQYLKRSMRGVQKELYICFYNKDFFLYVNTDVMDLISTDSIVAEVKYDFASYVDKRYENSADII